MSNITNRPVYQKRQKIRARLRQIDQDDEAYLAWLRSQPSCISGRFSEYVDGVGKSVCAHVRRARDAGTAYKPKLSAVPATQEEHLLQSVKGEAACLEHYLGGKWTVEGAKSWFDEQVQEHVKQWKLQRRISL